mmetsp:Transcript_30290/g.64172  ORF Transcript_30290/g.64172 Transcript_30290/m.64172 type:complete len:759 (+) Transcript_30290:275-2551(+)|eukprot:CAMPEP_0172304872 /NCGR_PEP_ID=MMETSP1058-20130122/6232_1 /TAXON_ID=83371 /ORGANISM="Detonula confervacea, Strain CCMP 353" /LENGTH=758 /DNA_ID=CAMNT_0013016271 /DNA_START=187 /DNA_END=2463 /DNA_ORIENTATION=-
MMKSLLVPLLASSTTVIVRAGWIDEDTPKHLRTTKSLVDGTVYDLVMSDEFNVPNRTFKDGDDPTWTALDKSDDDYSASGGGSLHFYNSTTVRTTPDGMLTISSVLEETSWTHYDEVEKEYTENTKHFKSGMIQSWNKFCFVGGIIEVDVILPGEPDIGGLWPAVWMLGNLGRATYEGSTNNLWPWSYDTCTREKQESQVISKCNNANHFGLNKNQGRGATEIDILELMGGDSNGPLPATSPPISLPYIDMTLQVAPGIPNQRPQSGAQPVRTIDHTHSGYATSLAENWYDNLTVAGNTSLNPFFYGTYLGETKPEEPVTRNKNQVFQADAVGAMKQLVPQHFKTPHTFRIEWQPGRGGRLDWFTKSHKKVDENGTISHIEGDGKGQDWEHSLHIPDFALDAATGSKIPEEPSYLIFNTAISSTWGFPYDVPDWCPKCYDCYDPKCTCSFNPGFCNMMKTGKVALKIDSVRVYQSKDDDAHDGQPHRLGCDPPEFPTKEYIKGYEYRYMRSAPFNFGDKHPLRKLKNGGGTCVADEDCGGGGVENTDVDESWVMPSRKKKSKEKKDEKEDVLDLDEEEEHTKGSSIRQSQSPLAHKDVKKVQQSKNRRLFNVGGNDEEESKGKKQLDKPLISTESLEDRGEDAKVLSNPDRKPKGECVTATSGLFGLPTPNAKQCKCNKGYTGPHCLSVEKYDDEPGAMELKNMKTLFSTENRANPYLTPFHVFLGGLMVGAFMVALVADIVVKSRKDRAMELTNMRS